MRNLPPVTKHLLFINLIIWLFDMTLRRHGIMLSDFLGLHYITAGTFRFWQPLTYMFMHSDFTHIFCNMFAVLMFGSALEQEWGWRKFIIYYIVCGVGAAIVQESVWALRIHHLLASFPADAVMQQYASQIVTIGASGAVFGILLAFGWLFPEVRMFILFIPIPIRARIFVIIYALIELLAGFSHIHGDNIAHFAHLGGMLFGLILIFWWNRDKVTWWHKLTSHNKTWLGKKMFHNSETSTRLDSSKDKDYSNYHYQSRIDE